MENTYYFNESNPYMFRSWLQDNISDSQTDKWKIKPHKNFISTFAFRNKLFLFAHLFLFLLPLASQLVSAQHWDGVIVTQADYQALQAIKRELIDFKGFLRSWNDSGQGACSGMWAGIKCAKGQIIAIQLPWRGLGGHISEKIGQLQALRKLSLHDNVLGGPVPWSLGFLPNLRGVYLFNNRLSGSIPPSVGNCPALQTLDLSNNSLTGTIPTSLANSTRLYRLNFSYNSLLGSIPVRFTRSPSLTILALQHNNLSGSVPDTWVGTGNNSYQLQFLTLDHNSLTGTIPVSLSKLNLLKQISLSHNQISGTIPDELGTLSKLQILDLSGNAINGSFPSSFSNLFSLVSLNLEGNHLDNQIPETLDNLQNLTVLNLKNNRLSGRIPATVGNISGINQLDLSGNNFTGEIPDSLASLTNLSHFNVSYNNLSGAVPSLLAKKFNSSSFVGNLQLCGYSTSTLCPSPAPFNLSPSPAEAPKHHHRKLSTKDIILIAAGGLLVILLILCCILICCLLKKKATRKQKSGKMGAAIGKTEKAVPVAGTGEQSGGEMGGKLVHFDGPFVFTADDLLCATAEIMGKSTYGTVYKATLEDGNQVAVKRLREKTTKGQREFETEAAALGKIRHPNLLALRAYYLGPKGEKLLVFDYMPKGSLASFLHARGPETTIDWPTRMKIAIGVTRGLNHLHTQENIIHGNLTSSNILLDEQANGHIADFGLSRLMTSAANTNVIATAGTLGYRAPELSKLKNASTKTDVYSLGVIILELLTGKSPGEPTNGMDLPQWVASIVKEEWTNEVFDLELMRDTPTTNDELLNTLKLALHCVDPSPAARPEVQHVLQQLEEIKPEVAAGGSGDDGAKVPATSE
ncbi:probably inactive leucine-rich repeat receptor-like protein kinase IMK2 [Durio zibethinus]|uniref:Probably inactive leucine-rich repeat receptor-like protein kinase IMK2 n=1 Tax=Durio zibethinus TaxID=66656 RepID=A0A6P6ASJ4_DURZI|nr:probably inactive leucine-rich repeat receptor-like protein kinase IMK2 [Durio zibethinus]XP_022767805.1 probably inactive leucine-rich repeat receptor-like protein kinase IMK2 [Durio zibethinus]XP_022767806.1 probably inactive leucine-rich repeat receptor-like protein kinase IMK2 [Durio zibethinus]